MMHTGIPSNDHPGLRSPYPIFRKRFRLEPPRSSTARCLFGSPDPAESQALIQQVHERAQFEFAKLWNFNTVIGLPVTCVEETVTSVEAAVPCVEEGEEAEQMDVQYNWVELVPEEEEKEEPTEAAAPEESCATPVSTPVSVKDMVVLPPTDSDSTPVQDNKVAEVVVEIQESKAPTPISPIDVFSPPNVQMDSGSEEEGRLSPPIGACTSGSCKAVIEVVTQTPTSRRLASSGPILRQRCITDYMKVKKATRTVKKVLR